jgi:predicted secreted protein
VVDEVVDVLRRHDVGFLQMFCPELTYAGAKRPRKTREEYDASEYRKYCRELALSTVSQIEEFVENGVEVVAVLGIQNSPSCDVGNSGGETGILMEELVSELEKRGFKIPMHSINLSEVAADVKWLEDRLGTC